MDFLGTPGGAVTVDGERATRDDLRVRMDRQLVTWHGARTVAVVARPTLDTVAAIVAALSAGATVVPVSADAGPRERDHVLSDSGAEVLVDGRHTDELRPQSDRAAPGDAALVLYTSGTTGPPKGVPITAEAIRTCLSGLADAWDWTADDTLVHGLPLHHVHGLVLGVLGPLLTGSALVHTGRPTPSAYAAAAGSLYFGVPTVWSRVAADTTAARALSGARLLVSGSAGLPAPVFDALTELSGQAPVERYGMTETLITVAARADEDRVRGSVGHPLPGVEVRLVAVDDASAGPVADGELGALEVRGPTVTAGYLNRPDATAEAMSPDGWFRTGDVARREDGTYRIVGRARSDLIKTGGYRVGAGEVEDALLARSDVAEAAVVGEPDDDLGQRIVAYVVAAPGATLVPETLVDDVASDLSWHKRPRRLVVVAELPRNAMGKVDKSRLSAG